MVTANHFQRVVLNFKLFTFLNCCQRKRRRKMRHTCPRFPSISTELQAPKTELFFLILCVIYFFFVFPRSHIEAKHISSHIAHVSHHKVHAFCARHYEKWTFTAAAAAENIWMPDVSASNTLLSFPEIHHYHSLTLHLLCHIRWHCFDSRIVVIGAIVFRTKLSEYELMTVDLFVLWIHRYLCMFDHHSEPSVGCVHLWT